MIQRRKGGDAVAEAPEPRYPVYAMVSTDIRRDLVAPLRHMTRLRLKHFYRQASYGDLMPDEMDENLVAYRSLLDLFHRLQEARPDILQGVEPFSIRLLPYLYAAFVAARSRQIPLVVVTLENRPLDVKHGKLFSRILRTMLRPVLGYANLIVYLNEGARRNVLSVGPYVDKLQRLMYGTWGVDLDEFTPQRDGREPELGRDPVLLFVGRLHVEKGVFDLLDAFGAVKSRAAGARLVLIGDGPARGGLERKVGVRGWTRDVILAGTVKNRDLPPYFRAADVFVAPSVTTRKWEEQVGMTNIQAMACGVPVISTHSGAIPEFVPDGVAGVLVPERSPSALAEAIIDMLDDKARGQRMGEAGREYCTQHYDARQNVRQAENALLGLVERTRYA